MSLLNMQILIAHLEQWWNSYVGAVAADMISKS